MIKGKEHKNLTSIDEEQRNKFSSFHGLAHKEN